MYIRITSRCNMSCEHCGFNCTHEGEDMSFGTFKAALEMDEYITIGGGEPTIHPEFEKFLLYAIGHCESTFIITNGSRTELSLTMLGMAKGLEDRFGVELSQDPYHDPIDTRVVDAFKKADRIRNVEGKLISAGRANEFFDSDELREECICSDRIVEPNGDIRACGCDNAPVIGNVFVGYKEEYEEFLEDYDVECWNDYLKTKEECA